MGGQVLHPELKALYTHGYGHAKNTVSFIDTAFAALAAVCCRWLFGRTSRSAAASTRNVPLAFKLRNVALPGTCVFLVIVLSTLANYWSYEVWALSGPCDLLFVWVLSRCFQPEDQQRPLLADLPAIGATACGTLLLAIETLKGSPNGELLQASVAALLCRACQAVMLVTLRGCCLNLRDCCSVAEIVQWKLIVTSFLCGPYALLTEGVAPWTLLASRSFWCDGVAVTLLLGSVIITLGFQGASVGASAGLRSPVVAVLVGTLQPLLGIALAVVLGETSLAAPLKLRPFHPSPLAILGASLLLLGFSLRAVQLLRSRKGARTVSSTGATELFDPSGSAS